MLRTVSLLTASRAGLLAAAFAVLLGCAGRPGPVSMAVAAECESGVTLVAASCAPRAMAAGADLVAAPDAAPAGDFAALMREIATTAPAVRAALNRWQAEDQKIDVTRSALNPALVAYGQGGGRLASGGGTTTGDSPYSYGVRASLPLFDGGATLLATKGQAALSTAARAAAGDELAATLVDIAASAAALSRAETNLRLRQKQLVALRELQSAVNHEISSGASTRADADQVASRISEAEAAIRQAQADRAEAIRAFSAISGQPPTLLRAVPSIADRLPRDRAEAERLAARDNPKIKRAMALADAAGLARKAADATGQPLVSLDMDFGRSGDLGGASSEQTAASLFLKFELPIGPSGSAEARRRQKDFEQAAASYDLAGASFGVFAGVDAALERLRFVREGLALTRRAAREAADAAKGMATERLLGDRTVFDEVSAITAAADADMAVAGLQYELVVAEHLLAAETGQIAAIYGLRISESSTR